MLIRLLCLKRQAKFIISLFSFFLLLALSENSFSDQVVTLNIPQKSITQSPQFKSNSVTSPSALNPDVNNNSNNDSNNISSQAPIIDLNHAVTASCSVKNYNTWGKCELWLKSHHYMQIKSYNFGVPYNVVNIQLQLASQGTDAMVFTNVVNSAEQGADQVVTLSAMGANGGAGRIFTSVAPEDVRQPVIVYLQNDGPSPVFVRVL